MSTQKFFPGLNPFILGMLCFLLVLTAVIGQWSQSWPFVLFMAFIAGVAFLTNSYRITVHAKGLAISRPLVSVLDLEFSQFDSVEISSHMRTRMHISRFLKGGAVVHTVTLSGRTFAHRLSEVLDKADVKHDLEDIGASWLIRMKTTPVS